MPSSHDQGDSFISDDEEELCPLCVEEMDLSDKNFKPCPCGYQVCQFCYNNIRQNPQLNGKCPACRRMYTDDSVEYRVVTADEWKQDHLRQTRKERERKQREREKKESEQTSKKHHLSGMRVIQKNLVYVIGLNPSIPTDELHHTLRNEQFFGQYGKIHKIVINRRNNANGNPGLGVYVTFARKDDAARCIAAVDGSMNDGKYLRAAYGTTKYCSSYLRGQTCPNPNCMFLHEPGEEADSYTRQDLSTIHAARQGIKSQTASTSAPRPAPPIRKDTQDTHDGFAEDGSALPATASWAHKQLQQQQAQQSVQQSTSAASSPTPAHVRPQIKTRGSQVNVAQPPAAAAAAAAQPQIILPEPQQLRTDTTAQCMNDLLEATALGQIEYSFKSDLVTEDDLNHDFMPPFFAFSDRASGSTPKTASTIDIPSLFQLSSSYGGSFLGYSPDIHRSQQTPPQQPQAVQHPQPQPPQAYAPQQQQPTVQQQAHPSPQRPPSQASKTSTPPPGLFNGGHHQSAPSQDRQVLLAQLMNGGRGMQQPTNNQN